MESLGYCEKHQRAYEIKRIPGSWVYECPECRKEGLLDTVSSNRTEMKPKSEWTVSNTIS